MKNKTTFDALKKFASTDSDYSRLQGIETIITENQVKTLATDSYVAISHTVTINEGMLQPCHMVQRLNGTFIKVDEVPNINKLIQTTTNFDKLFNQSDITKMFYSYEKAKIEKADYFQFELFELSTVRFSTKVFKKVYDMIKALQKEKFNFEIGKASKSVKPFYFKYSTGDGVEYVEIILSPMFIR